jgi:hypothetical protein
MICYTLSDCVLKNMNTAPNMKEITTDLLMVFPQKNNPHKVVVDKAGKIIDIYEAIIRDDHGSAIYHWLKLMGDFPESWETIDVDNIESDATNEDIFLIVCSQTKNKMLIVYNHNGWTKDKYYHKNSILHNNISIRVLDREEAINLLSLSEENAMSQMDNYEKDLQVPIVCQTTTNISNSIVATSGGSISEGKIEQK